MEPARSRKVNADVGAIMRRAAIVGGCDRSAMRQRDRILVTGANGQLGLHLMRRLAETDAPAAAVRAAVRSERAAQSVARLPERFRPETVIVDYAEPAQLARAADGCGVVVHLVGVIKESSTTRFADAHEASCSAIATAAEKAGVCRIVYLSVLGADPDASNACLASKGAAERILLAGAVPATVVRLPMVLGRGNAAARALRGQARARVLPLPRGGATRQQPIAADDVVEAIAAAASRDGDENRVLDLAGPESLSHRELVARAAALYGRRPIVVPLPLALVWAFAAFAERASADPPLSRAMLGVLEHDDCIDPAPACRELGIELTPLDRVLARCVGPEAEAS